MSYENFILEVRDRVALVKVARLITTPNHADSWTDGVGYLALGGGIASKPGRYV